MMPDIQTLRQNVAACLINMDESMKTEKAIAPDQSKQLIRGLELVADFLANLQVAEQQEEEAINVRHAAFDEVIAYAEREYNPITAASIANDIAALKKTAPGAAETARSEWSMDPNDSYRRLTEMKTRSIMEGGYKITGYVLRNAEGNKVCISEYSAVRWLGHKELFNIMHGVPQSSITDDELIAAFNSGHNVLNGLHEVLNLACAASARTQPEVTKSIMKDDPGPVFSNDLTHFKRVVNSMYRKPSSNGE